MHATHTTAIRRRSSCAIVSFSGLAGAMSIASGAHAQQSDWITNSGNFCTSSNWSPAGVPDFNRDVFIGRSTPAATVTLNCDVLVKSLTMQSASTLSTNGRQLSSINDLSVSESGGNSTVNVSPYASNSSVFGVVAPDIHLNTGTALNLLDGGRVQVGNSLNIASGAQAGGEGTLKFLSGSSPAAINNNGVISASGGTLTIDSSRPIDIDGTSGAGVLRVIAAGSQMIVLASLPPADAMSGVIDIGPGNWIQFTQPLSVNGDVALRGQGADHGQLIAPSMTFLNGSIVNVSAGVAHLDAPSMVFHSGSEIDIDSSAHLLVNCPTLDLNAGAITDVAGRLGVIGSTRLFGTTINGGDLIDLDSIHVVSGSNAINIGAGGEFNWDSGSSATTTTINAGASLTLNVPFIDYSNDGGLNDFNGTVINRGSLAVNTPGLWKLKGVMQLQRLSTSEPLPLVSGSDFEVSGRIDGTGMIQNVDVTAIGVISPGAAATTGRLQFSGGSLTLGQANRIDIDIGGATQVTQYDHVLAANAGNAVQVANLGGTLRVRLANGFVPTPGQEFSIMEGHTLSGNFHVIDAPGFEIEVLRFSGAPLDRVKAKWVGPACDADVAPSPLGDGQINVNDLLAVISGWGPCTATCPADCSPAGGDGQVNVNDLLAVITAWGTCD